MSSFTREDTFEKVAKIVADKLSIDKSRVVSEATLSDLGADSLDLVEIVMQLEEQFGIEIDDEKADQLQNINDVVDYVHSLRA